MSIDISKLAGKLRMLQQHRANLGREYEQKLAEIDAEIAQERSALDKVNEVLEPYICKDCGGSGEESFTDAAGSRDWRKCRHCKGTGINTG